MTDPHTPSGVHYAPSGEYLQGKNRQLNRPIGMGGRIPPQALEMEQCVLGAILQEPGAFDTAIEIVKPYMFYKESHKLVMEACQKVRDSGRPIDLIIVKNQLSSDGMLDVVGGMYYLTELTDKVASAANIEYHAPVIRQKWAMREVIKLCDAGMSKAFDETSDIFEIIESIQDGISMLEPSGEALVDAFDMVVPVIKDVEAAIRGEIKSYKIGFRDIDAEYLFDMGELVVVGGKSGTGKTTLFTQIAKNIRRMYPGIPVLVNSLEMEGKKVVSRDMASSIGVSQMRFRSGDGIGEREFKSMSSVGSNYKGIYFCQCWTNTALAVKVRKLRKQLNLAPDAPMLVIGDYAQIMEGVGGNREQEVASISRGAKKMCVSEKVLYILGSQLNNESGKNRPTARNLRESEALRNDADWVILLFNPKDNGELQYEDGSSTDDIVEAIFGKVRFGRAGNIIRLMMTPHGLLTDIPTYSNDGFPDPGRIQGKDITISNSERFDPF